MVPRKYFYIISFIVLFVIHYIAFYWPPILYAHIVIIPLILLGIYDILSRHNVLRNYPIIGHIRYMAEFIRPEIQQYFVASNLSGRPFNRETRSLVYQRAKGVVDTMPFGTQHDLTMAGNASSYHSIIPKEVSTDTSYIVIGNQNCKQPYKASRLNISAMSFGSLGMNAIMAMNRGAKEGGFAHNTGEGGISKYHLKHGGDLIWQVGTGYFGCRDDKGHFDSQKYKENAQRPEVKMIELKISQGAKPAHGGLLPGAKVTEEIAKARGVPIGKDCYSPPYHSSFSTPVGLLEFITELRELSGGKPVGFKLCIGKRSEFMSICKAMLKTNIYPDFITIDGAEGGTGAAPVEFANYLGTPINEALIFVENCLVGTNLRPHINIIASGKVASGYDIVKKIALGADMCNSARAMMFAVGCIQALKCHENTCPTGVTTQDLWRQRALIVDHKYKHVSNYHKATIESFLHLTGAIGLTHPDQLGPEHINRRINDDEVKSFDELYYHMAPGGLLVDNVHPLFKADWKKASADNFSD